MKRDKSRVKNFSEINNYKDLVVWQKAHELGKLVLVLAKGFPCTDEARIIKQQLVRSAISVPANIAEGYGGHRGAAYRNYLLIARRSLSESDYWLFLCLDVGFIGQSVYDQAISLVKEVRAMLTAIIDKLENQNNIIKGVLPLDS